MTRRRFQSIVNRLKKQHQRRQREQQRNSRQLRTERLEDRRLLAGPELIAIRPDEAALLQEDDTLNVAPREFNLLFNGGADLDEATILNNLADPSDNSIQLIRSGGDGTFGDGNEVVVDVGYLGLEQPGNTDPGNLQQIVLRPASSSAHNPTRPQASFPDDTYRILIRGTGQNPLRNRAGEAFEDGTTFIREFRLDRGAQVISVVPQPVSRNTHNLRLTGTVSGGLFALQLNGKVTQPISATTGNVRQNIQNALDALPNTQVNDVIVSGPASGGPWTITFQGQFAGEEPTLTADASGLQGTNAGINLTRELSLSQARDQIVVYFNDDELDPAAAVDPKFYRLVDTQATASDSDDAVLLPTGVTYDAAANSAVLTFASIPDGTFRLDVGVANEDDSSLATAVNVGTLFNTSNFEQLGFIGDNAGTSSNQADVDLYRISVRAGSRLDLDATPHSTNFDVDVRLFASDGITPIAPNSSTEGGLGGVDALTFNSIAGTGFVELIVQVASEGGGGGSGSYLLDVNVSGASGTISTNDFNSTFASATQLGQLGAGGVTHSAQIQAQTHLALPAFPGGEDEPGHRLIQPEAHVGSFGLGPITPGPITTRFYNFNPLIGGSDPQGNPYLNLISEQEKQLTREIYEIYGSLVGIEFVETPASGTRIAKGDLRSADPNIASGPGGVAGLGGAGLVVLDFQDFPQSNNVFGGSFFNVMFHEVGHSLGLGHSYDIPSVQGPGIQNQVWPGDHDIVHLNRIWRPDSTDIDLYQFSLDEPGHFSAEINAERRTNTSLLNSALTLYQEHTDGTREVIARNDDYFSNDSFIGIDLEAGTYFLGVTSIGNTDYDPNIVDSGFGGTTDGAYDLLLNVATAAKSTLMDRDGTQFDGDADGAPGGRFSFWFESSQHTIFVDKANDSSAGAVDGVGTLADPYDTISFALEQAGTRIIVPVDRAGVVTIADGDTFVVDDGANPPLTFEFDEAGSPGLNDPLNHLAIPFNRGTHSASAVATQIESAIDAAFLANYGTLNVATATGDVVQFSGISNLDLRGSVRLLTAANVVRVVGNSGLDGNIQTLNDNSPYLIGLDNSSFPLSDGQSMEVPQGVTAMVDAGAMFKMRKGNLDAGTSSTLIDRSGAAMQILGTPTNQVFFFSLRNDSVGGDSDGVGPAAQPGDYGGIVFRADSDLEDQGVFLNWVNHASLNNGGGKVFVDSAEEVFAPVHMLAARPTVSFNTITNSANASMSANPNSFDDAGGRLGPDIYGNYLSGSSINGLFVAIESSFGAPLEKLDVTARFDDDDITHVITENLLIRGNAGGPFQGTARLSGRLHVDPGVVVKLSNARIEMERGASSLIAEGTAQRQVILTSLNDDRFGGSGTFDSGSNGFTTGSPGDWGGLIFNHVSSGSIDNALIAFGGGQVPIEGGSDRFNAIEVHQARLRLTNSALENHANGQASTNRNGRGNNSPSTIHVRGAQPIIVNNIIRDNAGRVLSINANALQAVNLPDYGRATGSLDAFVELGDNNGPLVRLNRLEGNLTNGMDVRGEQLTTQTVWDDTDIVHVLRSEIVVNNHHTYSGVRLKSSNTESLVVKLQGANAGFTANGRLLEIDDRIGGTVQVIGSIGHPVVMTSLADDSVGAGFTPDGRALLDTNNGGGLPQPGDYRGILLDQLSNDRNVRLVDETENVFTDGNDINALPPVAQAIGTLAKDQKSGDENIHLGFEVHGFISPDDPTDIDVYSFSGTAGTEVWLDIDRTSPDLDAIVELLNISGTVLARSIGKHDAGNLSGSAQAVDDNPLLIGDFYSRNFRDPGMRVLLPGVAGAKGTYFVRVRSNPKPDNAITDLNGGLSSGAYQLQIRLQQVDEFPGSTVRFADIRYAATAIDIRGLPAHSNILGDTDEVGGSNFGAPENLGNVFEADRAAISVSGALTASTQQDFYQFSVQHAPGSIQSIGGVNAGGKTGAVVIDLDYADGAARADTGLFVFDTQGNLLLVGRESNIEDDQGRPGFAPDTTDLSRGSLGRLDPFIGPVHLPEGAGTAYRVAVASNSTLPDYFNQYVNETPFDTGFRLEPVNSVTRIAEDHIGFQGYNSNGPTIAPVVNNGLFQITSTADLATNVVPFNLGDVVLYLITDNPSNGNNDSLYTANPFAGGPIVTRVTNNVFGGVNDVQDIVIRSNGEFFGYQRLNAVTNTVGGLVTVNPETGQATAAGNDNILGRAPTPNVSSLATNINNRAEQFTTSDEVDAFTFERRGPATADGSAPTYDVYYSVRERGSDGGLLPSSKLYRARQNGDASPSANTNNPIYGQLGSIQPAGVSFASQTLSVFDGANPPNRTDIRIESKVPGIGGNSININISRPNNTNANVSSVAGTTINLQIGGTGTPINAGPSAQAIVDAINNNADARELVTAVIVGGSGANNTGANGTAAVSFTGGGPLSGGGGTPLTGNVTGLAFADFFGGGSLYGVTSGGEILQISRNNGSATVLNAVPGASFQGLALGPQNVSEFLPGGAETQRRYSNMMFAVTGTGTLYAFDTSGALQAVFDSNGDGFADSTSVNISGAAGGQITGLAFSPLDFNLWHPTVRRGTEAGHGISPLFDNSRTPNDVSANITDPGPGPNRNRDQSQGGASFYFGFEEYVQNPNSGTESYLTYQSNSQLGIYESAFHSDLASNTTIGHNYNLPGGALGRLETDSFSLEPYAGQDKPTLYFNYFLQTENHGGSTSSSDGGNPFRDSARVFVSRDDGASWELVATNNSTRSTEVPNNAELPIIWTDSSTEGARFGNSVGNQQVQELFDTTNWRQARVDLSGYAGQANLKLRFDFSTAGAMNDPTQGTINTSFGEFSNSTRSIRSQNNAFEGFYIDDIIIGFSERGEMAVTTQGGGSDFFTVPQPPGSTNPQPEVLVGPYQVEVRRADDFAGLVASDEPDVSIGFSLNGSLTQGPSPTYDTNERVTLGHTLIAPNGGALADGMTFTVVGRTTRVFEFNSVGGVTTGRTAVPFNAGMNDDQVAASIRNAINGVADFGVLAILHTNTTNRVDLVNAKSVNAGGAPMGTESYKRVGDSNRERDQGLVLIESNVISNARDFGISVQSGAGSPINFAQLNSENLAPGPVIQNNIIVASDTGSGIRFAGDATTNPLHPRPFGRLINNTVFGGSPPTTGLAQDADVIFLQDTTLSMEPIISGIVDRLLTMDTAMQAAGINVRYGAVRLPESSAFIGGSNEPRLIQDITDFTTFSAPNAPYPSLVNDAGGAREAGSEAVLEALNQFDPQTAATTFNYTPNARTVTVLITTENDDSPGSQAAALTALQNANAIFFGIIDPDIVTEPQNNPNTADEDYRPFANATGGQIFDIADFQSNPDVFFDAFVQSLIVAIGGSQAADGIVIENNAAPTLLNNIVSGFQNGVTIDGTSQSTVLDSTLFQNNANNVVGAGTGASPIFLQNSDPLFVNPLRGNFYPAPGSPAIDSSLNAMQDRNNFVTFKSQLGIPSSQVFAPDRDVFGQLRVDDPNEDPIGGGSAVFKDRGAVDRADDQKPYADLLFPVDNDAEGLDLDPNRTIVHRQDSLLSQISIKLGDGAGPNLPFQGTNINDRTVDIPTEVSDPNDPDATISQRAVRITRNGQPLVEDVDYNLGYNAGNGTLLLTPLSSVWEPNSIYVLTLDNTLIQDRAGNFLQHNQADGSTRFTIILPGAGQGFAFDYGDAPNVSYGTLLLQDGARHVILPEFPLTLGQLADGDPDGQPNTAADGDDNDTGVDVSGTPGLTSSPLAPFTALVPAGGPAAIAHNDQFRLSDGTNTRIFSFDKTGGAITGDVRVNIIAATNPDDVANAIAAAVQGEINAGRLFGFSPKNVGNGKVSFGGQPLLTLTGFAATKTPASTAVRYRLQMTPKIELEVPSAIAGLHGQTFTLNDGVTSVSFGFRDSSAGSSVTATEIISYDSAVDTAADVASRLAAGIRNRFGELAIGNAGTVVTLEGLRTAASITSNNTILTQRGPAWDGTSFLADGSTFTINDGLHSPVTFEFDRDGSVSGSNVPIAFTRAQSIDQIGANVVAAIEPRIGTGALSGLSPAYLLNLPGTPQQLGTGLVHIADRTEAGVDLSGGPLTLTNQLPVVIGTSPVGLAIQVSRTQLIRTTGGINALSDGATFTIDDGVNASVRFEFDKVGNGVTFGNRRINVSSNPTSTDPVVLRDAILQAISDAINLDLVLSDSLMPQAAGDDVQLQGADVSLMSSGIGIRGPVQVGDRFTVTDGAGGSVTFQFGGGANPVAFTVGNTANQVAAAIRDALLLVVGGALDAGTADPILFDEAIIELGETLPAVTVTNDTTNNPNLDVTNPMGPTGGIKDGQTFTVDRGTSIVTFEFDRNGSLSDDDHVAISLGDLTEVEIGTSLNSISSSRQAVADATAAAAGGANLSTRLLNSGTANVSVELRGDDEDGVVVGKIFVPTQAAADYVVPIEITASGPGKLDAWIDFNRNNQFAAANGNRRNEEIFQTIDVVAGRQVLFIDPDDFVADVAFVPGETYARFRISPEGVITPTGLVIGGEIEDYLVRVLSNLEPAVANAFTSDVSGSLDLIDAYDTSAAAGLRGVLEIDEDQLHDAVAPGVDLELDLLNIDAAVPGGAANNGFADDLFADVNVTDGSGDLLNYQIVSNSTPTLVTANLLGTRLQLNFHQDQHDNPGLTTIVLEATDHAGLTARETLTISVKAVNDAPSLTVPGPQVVHEGNDLAGTLASLAIQGIRVSDIDANELGGGPVVLTLSVPAGQGNLQVNGSVAGGVPAGSITGNASPAVTLTGSVAEINATLASPVGVTYIVPNDDFNADVNEATNGMRDVILTLNVNDQGNTGATPAPGFLQDTETIAITVNPINDPPEIRVDAGGGDMALTTPPSFTVAINEDSPFSFDAAHDALLSVIDVDAQQTNASDYIDGVLNVTLSVLHGTLTVTNTAPVSGSLTGNGTATVIFSGTQANITAALMGLGYTPDLDYNDNIGNELGQLEQLTLTIDDRGQTGAESPSGVTTRVIPILVAPINDAPVILVDRGAGPETLPTTPPFSISTNEDIPFTFDASNNASLQVIDVDAEQSNAGDYIDGMVTVNLLVLHGTLSLTNVGHLPSPPSGLGTSSIVFTALQSDVTTALDGLVYTPDADFNDDLGSEQLTISVDDRGQTGDGSGTTSRVIPISVNAVNDQPRVFVDNGSGDVPVMDTNVTTDEDQTLTFNSSTGPKLTVMDIDAEQVGAASNDYIDGELTVTLSVRYGRLTVTNTGPLGGAPAGNGTSSVSFKASQIAITAALDGLRYTPDLNYNDNIGNQLGQLETLTFVIDDHGQTGQEVLPTSVTRALPILVRPINDAPVIVVPSVQPTTNEETTFVFNAGNSALLTVSDVDAEQSNAADFTENGRLLVAMNVHYGTLALASTTGLTFTDSNGADGSLAFAGRAADVNAALNGLTYLPQLDYNNNIGSGLGQLEELTISVNDQGQTGDEAPLTSLTTTRIVPISVQPINDAPVVTVPGTQTTAEGTTTPLAVPGVIVSDVDVTLATEVLQVTLTVPAGDGTVAVVPAGGATATPASGPQIVLRGNVADLNQTLATLTYALPNGDFNSVNNGGDVLISVVVDDQGNVGPSVPPNLTGSGTVTIAVTQTNDAPVITQPAPPDGDEGTDPTIDFNGQAISVSDVDNTLGEAAANAQWTLTLSVPPGAGRLNVDAGLAGGVPASNITGSGTRQLVMSGSITQLNATLNTLTYTVPDNDFNSITHGGPVVLSVSLNDNGNVGGAPLTTQSTLSMTVNPINDRPIANHDSFSVNEDTALTIPSPGILLNDTDVDIPPQTLTVLNPSGITSSDFGADLIVTANGSFQYDPTHSQAIQQLPVGQTLQDVFRYRIQDDGLNPDNLISTEATVTITVTGRNDLPVASNVSLSVLEDAPPLTASFDVTDVDSGEMSSLRYLILSQPSEGNVAISGNPGDPQFVFNQAGGFQDLQHNQTRQVSFTYRARDVQNGNSNIATVTITVTGVNDQPVANDISVITTEDGPPIVDLFAATDADNSNLTYTIVTPPGPNNGTASVGGDTFTFSPGNDFQSLGAAESRQVTFTYRANDNTGLPNANSNLATVTVTVSGLNDAPVANDDTSITTEDASLSGLPSLLANDVEVDASDTLTVISFDPVSTMGATVTVDESGNYTYDPTNAAALQALLTGQQIVDTFRYTIEDSQGAADTATVSITINGVNDTPTARSDTAVIGEDSLLTAPPRGVLSNDSDLDANQTASLESDAGSFASSRGAQVTMGPNGGYAYDPRNASQLQALAQGESLIDTFTYTVRDVTDLTSIGTVSVTVQGINDAPIANDDNYSTNEDTLRVVASSSGVFANDSDPDNNDTFTLQSFDAASASGATVSVDAGGGFQYDPRGSVSLQALANGQTVTDTFTYTIKDSLGVTDSATVTITVSGVNDAPAVVNDTAATNEDAAISISAANGLLANDTDVEGDSFSITQINSSATNVGSSITLVSGATLFVTTSGSFDYNPTTSSILNGLKAGAIFVDTFTYRVSDGQTLSTPATVSITVTGVNDRPTAVADTFSTSEDIPLNAPAAGLLANDHDVDGDPLSVVTFNGLSARGAVLTLNANGGFSYDPTGVAQIQGLGTNETLQDTFTYTIVDGQGGSATSTATITVTGVNDLPIANHDGYRIDENSKLIVEGVGILDNDVDADQSDTLVVESFDSTSVLGAPVTVNADGTFTYDPTNVQILQELAPGETLVDRFTYAATDGQVTSNRATVTITVDGRNDAPRVQNDTYAATEDAQLIVQVANGVLVNDSDPEGSTLSASLVSQPANGTVVMNSSGFFTYTPKPNFFGPDTFTYRASDGAANSVGTVTINVQGVNDPPTAVADSYQVNEGTPLTVSAANGVLANDLDVDLETLQAVQVSPGPNRGTLNLNSNGSFTYTPNVGFFGTDTFRYKARDAAGAESSVVTVTIEVLNTKPKRNPVNNLDASADGFVSPIDVLLVVNELELNGSHAISPDTPAEPPFWDVNGDNFVSPVDANNIITFLNNGGVLAESESLPEQAALTLAEADSIVLASVDESFWLREAPQVRQEQTRTAIRQPVAMDRAAVLDAAFATASSEDSRQTTKGRTFSSLEQVLGELEQLQASTDDDLLDAAIGDLFGRD